LLAKDEIAGGKVFRDMFEDMVRGLKKPGDRPRPPRRPQGPQGPQGKGE
jgi:hypothetical protein